MTKNFEVQWELFPVINKNATEITVGSTLCGGILYSVDFSIDGDIMTNEEKISMGLFDGYYMKKTDAIVFLLCVSLIEKDSGQAISQFMKEVNRGVESVYVEKHNWKLTIV